MTEAPGGHDERVPSAMIPAGTLARLYERTVAAADALHRRRAAVALVGAPLVTLVLVAINKFVLLDFPNSGDEYAYLYQAQTYAAGRLWNAPPAPPELFTFSYIVQEPERAFSSFPFGWPLVLAMAMATGIPAWLVNPLLGTATLALVWWLGARLYAPRIGVLSAALVAISPFFLFNAASYFSHTFCGALLVAAACVASRDERRPAWVPLLVGGLIGWAVVARYLTGVVCGVPIVIWLLRPGTPRLRGAVLVAFGGLPWVVALAAYNTAMTGDPTQLTTTPLTVSLWFRDGFALRGADILSTHLLRHLQWTPPVLILAYVWYLRTAPASTRRAPLEWLLVVTVAVLYFYVERGGNQYGPRFHYEVFLFLVVFVTANVFGAERLAVDRAADRRLFAALAVSVLAMPLAFAVHARVERRVIEERTDPYRKAAEAGLSEAIVLMGGRVGSARSMSVLDLTRNGIDYRGPVLYGLDPGDEGRCAPATRVGGRRVYLYVWDHAAGHGQLLPIPCGAAAAQ